MRRLPALLLGASLAVAPVSGALAKPDDTKTNPDPVETFQSFTMTSRARLGIMVIQLTPELRTHFGAASDRGVLVGRVEPKSAAAEAGLAVGDVITEVRGTAVEEATDVISALAPAKKGEKVTVQVMRDGKQVSLTATMTDEPSRVFDSKLDGKWPTWFRDMFQTWPFDPPSKPNHSTST
jgi:C-terminal processing protease CtpA/Prc